MDGNAYCAQYKNKMPRLVDITNLDQPGEISRVVITSMGEFEEDNSIWFNYALQNKTGYYDTKMGVFELGDDLKFTDAGSRSPRIARQQEKKENNTSGGKRKRRKTRRQKRKKTMRRKTRRRQ